MLDRDEGGGVNFVSLSGHWLITPIDKYMEADRVERSSRFSARDHALISQLAAWRSDYAPKRASPPHRFAE